jgi:tetratricopeptide (TPR) repeat protein
VQQQEQEPQYTEEEYNAYEQAVNEPDLAKRAEALLAFLDTYPESKLKEHIVGAYERMLYDVQQAQDYEKLEWMAEKWLPLAENELRTIGYVAESAEKLGHKEKYIEYALKIFDAQPSSILAYYICEAYKGIGDNDKAMEWTLKLFEYPEFDDQFQLRYEFAQRYAGEGNLAKAAEYANLTLKSLAAAKKPEETAAADWNKATRSVKYNCHWLIGQNYYSRKSYEQAIKSLEQALNAERHDEPYYYIGHSLWKLDKIEEAILSFAKAEVLDGKTSSQAKEHLVSLYKALHNQTTIGIDKVYRRAKKELGLPLTASK